MVRIALAIGVVIGWVRGRSDGGKTVWMDAIWIKSSNRRLPPRVEEGTTDRNEQGNTFV